MINRLSYSLSISATATVALSQLLFFVRENDVHLLTVLQCSLHGHIPTCLRGWVGPSAHGIRHNIVLALDVLDFQFERAYLLMPPCPPAKGHHGILQDLMSA